MTVDRDSDLICLLIKSDTIGHLKPHEKLESVKIKPEKKPLVNTEINLNIIDSTELIIKARFSPNNPENLSELIDPRKLKPKVKAKSRPKYLISIFLKSK